MKKQKKCLLETEVADEGNAVENARAWMKKNGYPTVKIRSRVLIIGELIKYGRQVCESGRADEKATLTLQGNPDSMTLSLSKHVDESAEKALKDLDQLLQFVNGYQNRSEGIRKVQRRFTEMQTRPGPDHLSLIRVSVEENAELDFYVDENHVLILTVVCPNSPLKHRRKRTPGLAKDTGYYYN
jgi:hypothetical protein